MATDVIVAWRAGCAHRERAWAHVRSRYADAHPAWRVVEASAPAGPWCKAAAVTPAIAASDADVIVVADADVWCDGISEAASVVGRAEAVWAIPHRQVFRLTEASTTAVIDGADPRDLPRSEKFYDGYPGGGITILSRELALEVPMDPRFVGWGQEDRSWATALHCLAGLAWRGEEPLWHLWHPPAKRMTRRRGSQRGWQLMLRYRDARHDPDKMRALLEEFDGDRGHDQPAVHARPHERVR